MYWSPQWVVMWFRTMCCTLGKEGQQHDWYRLYHTGMSLSSLCWIELRLFNHDTCPSGHMSHSSSLYYLGYLREKASSFSGRLQCGMLRREQNGWYFVNTIFNCISLNENIWNSNRISLKFVLRGPINNKSWMIQVRAWHQTSDKPLSEPKMSPYIDAWAPSQYKDRLIYVWRFPC